MATSLISREKSPIAVLLNPENDCTIGERDIRVEDYLNDKLQTASDLIDIPGLLASVEAQRLQVEAQVRTHHNNLPIFPHNQDVVLMLV